MNHRRSVAAVAVLAAVGLAACGEADDAQPTPTTGAPVSINQVERAAEVEAEAQALAEAQEAWSYYYRVTHPAPKAAVPQSANQIEHRANFEARLAEAAREAAARGPVSANQAEHAASVEASVEVTVEELRRGENIKE
jgi:hypothetical protein